jgi:CubicO group peptidase (beta-lactamase class C family)
MDGDKLVEKIKGHMEELHVPGVAVGVRHGDESFTEGLGVTNVDHPIPVDRATLFQIGSITKTFVGTLTMRLMERGDLDLDAPIRDFLPGFRVVDEEASEKATLRHLFTHTAGWVGDWFPEDLGHGEDAVSRYVATMAENPQLTPLGEVLSYNNAGFNVAGAVIEAVTGKPFTEAMQEMLLDPLEMGHTYLLPWDLMTHRFAVGHSEREERAAVSRPWSIGRASGPAGGLVTCVGDMLNYAEFQLGDGTFRGERLLEPDSLRTLHTPQLQYYPNQSVALTFWVDDSRAARTLSHSGGTVGQTSMFTLVPDRDLAIILVTNSGNGSQLNRKVTNWVLEHYLGVETPELSPIEVPQDRLAEYAGGYKAALTEAEVEAVDGGLAIRRRSLGGFPTRDIPPPSVEPGPPVRYGFYGEDLIVGLEAPNRGDMGQFLRDPDGGISWLRLGKRIYRPL